MDEVLPGLTIDTSDDLIVVAGEVDAHTASTLDAHLLAALDRPLRLDLAAVTFMDSSGLRVLIDTHQRTADTEHPLTLVRPSRPVTRLLEISGLTDHVHIDPA